MTGDDETFKELTSSIEAFERTVRTRSQPKKPDPKPPDPELQPREAAQPVGLASPTGSFATARATQSPRGWRSRGDLTLVVLAGLLLLSGLLYLGDRTVFRVRIGTYPDRQAAEAVGQRVLEEEGLGWYVLRGR